MRKRSFRIAIGVLITGIAALLVANYFRHGFYVSPFAILLAILLLVGPLRFLLPLEFISMVFQSGNMPEQIAEARRTRPVSPWSTRICAASFLVSHIWLGGLIMLVPPDPSSVFFEFMLLPWLGLFLFGALGLILFSGWIQSHAIGVASVGAIALFTGIGIIVLAVRQDNMRDIFAGLDLLITSSHMILTPVIVRFMRSIGQID